jgi:hypothetical protein
MDDAYGSPRLVAIRVLESPNICEPRLHEIGSFLGRVLDVPLHLSDGFVHDLLVVLPLLRIEMEWTGFLLHPVRQLGEVDSEVCSSRSILTQAFQRGESGNVERGSLMEVRSDMSKLTNFRDDFCCTAGWFLGLSNLWSLGLRCQNLGVDKVFVVGGQSVEVPDEIEQLVFAFGCQETANILPRCGRFWRCHRWHFLLGTVPSQRHPSLKQLKIRLFP